MIINYESKRISFLTDPFKYLNFIKLVVFYALFFASPIIQAEKIPEVEVIVHSGVYQIYGSTTVAQLMKFRSNHTTDCCRPKADIQVGTIWRTHTLLEKVLASLRGFSTIGDAIVAVSQSSTVISIFFTDRYSQQATQLQC